MTRTQLIVIIALIIVIAAIAVPRAIKMSRISSAEHHVASMAKGFALYLRDTGQECNSIADLLKDPGITGWLGPYFNEEMTRNPWGGGYEADSVTQKIGIPKGDAAPDQYEFGGSEEISFSFSEDMGLE